MRVDVLSREYPPEVYGGACVHVAELVRALREGTDIEVAVRAFGMPRDECIALRQLGAVGLFRPCHCSLAFGFSGAARFLLRRIRRSFGRCSALLCIQQASQ